MTQARSCTTIWDSRHDEHTTVCCQIICDMFRACACIRSFYSSSWTSQPNASWGLYICDRSRWYDLKFDLDDPRGIGEGCQCVFRLDSAKCTSVYRLLCLLLVISRTFKTLRIHHPWLNFQVMTNNAYCWFGSQVDLESLGHLVHVPLSSAICLLGLLCRALFSGVLVSHRMYTNVTHWASDIGFFLLAKMLYSKLQHYETAVCYDGLRITMFLNSLTQ